jgi:hypothetical protein
VVLFVAVAAIVVWRSIHLRRRRVRDTRPQAWLVWFAAALQRHAVTRDACGCPDDRCIGHHQISKVSL